jgi:DNA-binding GntR family transcriptional regulator
MPRKGTFVRKITDKDAKDIFPIRAYIEGLAGRFAVDNLKYEDAAKIELALEKMTESGKKNNLKS